MKRDMQDKKWQLEWNEEDIEVYIRSEAPKWSSEVKLRSEAPRWSMVIPGFLAGGTAPHPWTAHLYSDSWIGRRGIGREGISRGG